MNVNEEDEKIVRARELLKKFQTKQSRRCSINESDAVLCANVDLDNASSTQSSGGLSFQADDSQSLHLLRDGISRQCSPVATPILANEITSAFNNIELKLHDQLPKQIAAAPIDKCHSLSKITGIENHEIVSLRNALSQKQQEFNESQSKLRELHRHYADLHSSYGHLSERLNQHEKTGPEQIQQLSMALSVALEEKMSLQNELRELKLDAQKTGEKQMNSASATPSLGQQQHTYDPTTFFELEAKLNHVVAERDHLTGFIAKQSTQIEHQRRECSSLEAKMVLMQQDRIDAQGRIKSLYATKAQLEQIIEQQRSDLSMRDIYIKQLSRHAGTDADYEQPPKLNVHQNDIASTHYQEIQKKLEAELEWHRNRINEMQKQFQLVQEQHQTEKTQSIVNIKRLTEQLDNLRASNAQLETSNNVMEERLRILQKQHKCEDVDVTSNSNGKQLANDSADNELVQANHLTELDRLRNALMEMTKENEIVAAKLHDNELLMQQKDHAFDELQQALEHAQLRVAHLEQLQNVQSTMNTDVSLLSSQLQTEKATVSRAVAQNVELKAQLTELQDRLIVVINESAAKEDERLTALATIERLAQQLNQNNAALVMLESPQTDATDDEALAQPFSTNTQTVASLESETINTNCCDVGLQTDDEQENIVRDQLHNSENIENVTTMGDEAVENLAKQMEALSRENTLYRSNNERLEYWLTALESENESIGEYIALYRFQRTQIQQRIAEKDSTLHQLQQQNVQLMAALSELRAAIIAVMQKNEAVTMVKEEEANASPETQRHEAGVDNAVSCEHSIHHAPSMDDESTGRLMRILERSEAISKQVTCMAVHQAQIHCTGCVECQGELFTL